MSKTLTYATVCSGIECMSAAVADLPMKPIFFSEIEPFPCAVLKSHFPDVPNLGDMSKIEVTNDGLTISNGKSVINLERGLDIFAGGTPCFVAGTMVLTPKGYVPIETLKVGDEVVTHKGRFRKVLRIGSKIAKTAEAHIVSRPPMRCTLDHKFWSATKKHKNHKNHLVIDDCGFLEIEKNITGYVAQQRNYDIPMPTDFPLDALVGKEDNYTPLESILEIAGWYCGDGCIRTYKGKKTHVVVLCVNANKLALLKERLGKAFHICQGKPDKNGVFKVQICSTILAKWLNYHFGKCADGKKVPAWLIAAQQPLRDAFIRGYLATDGCTLPNGTLSFTTISKALAYGVADILRDACVFYNGVPPRCVIQGREVNQRPFYIIRKNLKPNRFHAHKDWAFVRVKSLTKQAIETVYQIEVEEDHSYVSNGVVSRNCQDVSVAGKRSGMQEGSGTRSSLAFEFIRLVRELKPRYVLWENVAGVLSDKSFPEFLSALANCGYGVAYRTLDAQWVRCADIYHPDGGVVGMERAIPQRRRRVWVVGCIGADVSKATEILFEHKSIVGDTPPRRRTGQEIARLAEGRNRVHGAMVGGAPGDGECVSLSSKQQSLATDSHLAATLGSNDHKEPQCIALEGNGCRPSHRGDGISEEGVSYTLNAIEQHKVAYGIDQQGGKGHAAVSEGVAPTMCSDSHGTPHGVAYKRTNGKGEDVAATLSADDITQSGQGYVNNSVVECYRIDPKSSNSMKSANPHSGFHKAEVSACLDTTIPEPSKAQGGNVIVECFNKVSHARGKDGEGERWAEGDVASTRNVFDISETRTQECVVTTNSNGGDVMPTLASDLAKQTSNQQTNGGGIASTGELI